MSRLGRFVTFATIGALNVTQELAASVLGDVEGADADQVAEETLCLVATATARAARVGFRDAPETASVASQSLFDLPLIYRDYLLGGAMLQQEDAKLAELGADVYDRLLRKRDFYAVHLPDDQFPGGRALDEKMSLWMGRISPPGLPETPTERLARLGLLGLLEIHLRLVLAYARHDEPSRE